jgi:hypothetical protein
MHIIELTLKNTPMPLSVQRKLPEDAESVYKQILSAITSGSTQVLELTCERQPEKKVAVFSSEVVAVQMYEKSSTAASGRAPGFFAFAAE